MRSLKDIRRIIESIPRQAFLGICVLLGTAVLFVLSMVFLGGARDDALIEGRRINDEISTITKSITQKRVDREYVEQNTERYEALMKSDKLVPHTRRAALTAMREAATPHGLENSLNFTFSAANASSLESAASQPTSGAYRVNVETITLSVSAPYDGAIYRFLDDVTTTFPGAVALESLKLTRATEVNESELFQISAGAGKLVVGDIVLSWRTAQKEEESPGAAR
ncbi:MAG: hypothetical protein IT566_11790 [Rhodospirillaceae bacterium]|nr:hypothetical protein [Rhodospirillaceae bacterium]